MFFVGPKVSPLFLSCYWGRMCQKFASGIVPSCYWLIGYCVVCVNSFLACVFRLMGGVSISQGAVSSDAMLLLASCCGCVVMSFAFCYDGVIRCDRLRCVLVV